MIRALGIDIGGTAVKAGLLGPGGAIGATLEKPSPAREGPGVMAALVAAIVRELDAMPQGGAGGVGPTPGRPCPYPIGIGCAGLVDPERGVVLTSPNLPGWTAEAPLADLVTAAIGARPVLLNDANAFVFAETRLGAGRGCSTVVGITLGTGVGGGLVLGHRLWVGRHGAAGEIGHMPILIDGPPCKCGSRGCLEALVGTPAILARYRSLSTAPAPDPGPTVRDLAERAEAGEAPALATFRETGRILGLALAGLTQLLDPELFVVGGGVSRASALFLPAAREALTDAAMLPAALLPPVEVAALGPDAGWIGAALAAAESPAER